MSKLMELPEVKINTSRSGFDLSEKVCYSAKAGEMLPIWWQEMIPGETKKLRLQSFSRTQPMNTSAYTRCREYFDFYFVPYTQMWKQWRMFATQMQDNSNYAKDINNSQVTSSEHPYFTYKQVANYIYTLGSQKDELGYLRADKTIKLLEYLGYGDFTRYKNERYADFEIPSGSSISPDDIHPVNMPLNPFPLLAYQKIYNDSVRNSQWERSLPSTFNLDYITGSNDLQIPIDSIYTTPNMFTLRYYNWPKDYYYGLLPNSQYGDEAVVPLFDKTALDNVTGDLPVGFKFNFGTFDPTTGNPQTTTYTIDNLRSQIELSDGDVWLGNLKGRLLDSQGAPTGDQPASSQLNLTNLNSQLADSLRNAFSDLSILLLRQYEMLQKYREVQQAADTDYKSQIERLFGVSLSAKDSDQVRWLGGISRNFEFSEVVNTNLDRQNPKSEASIYGKGVSVADGEISVNVGNEYGIVMCIYHVSPLLDYSLTCPLKCNTKYKFSDYAQPAFDRLGLQAIPLLELCNSPKLLVDLISKGWTKNEILTGIIGYGPRYLDYKTRIDRVVGVFRTTELQWVSPITEDYLLNSVNNLGSAQKPTYPVSDTLFDYTSFKINPAVLNPIFGFDVDSTVDSDQFLVNCFIECGDVKNLDYDGMPY